eukprot:m.106490 g.106490  ORF g.106490 m.106490 type:complete len:1047 (+) comp27727_c0_seq1:146-3286(+)
MSSEQDLSSGRNRSWGDNTKLAVPSVLQEQEPKSCPSQPLQESEDVNTVNGTQAQSTTMPSKTIEAIEPKIVESPDHDMPSSPLKNEGVLVETKDVPEKQPCSENADISNDNNSGPHVSAEMINTSSDLSDVTTLDDSIATAATVVETTTVPSVTESFTTGISATDITDSSTESGSTTVPTTIPPPQPPKEHTDEPEQPKNEKQPTPPHQQHLQQQQQQKHTPPTQPPSEKIVNENDHTNDTVRDSNKPAQEFTVADQQSHDPQSAPTPTPVHASTPATAPTPTQVPTQAPTQVPPPPQAPTQVPTPAPTAPTPAHAPTDSPRDATASISYLLSTSNSVAASTEKRTPNGEDDYLAMVDLEVQKSYTPKQSLLPSSTKPSKHMAAAASELPTPSPSLLAPSNLLTENDVVVISHPSDADPIPPLPKAPPLLNVSVGSAIPVPVPAPVPAATPLLSQPLPGTQLPVQSTGASTSAVVPPPPPATSIEEDMHDPARQQHRVLNQATNKSHMMPVSSFTRSDAVTERQLKSRFFNEIKVGNRVRIVANARIGHHDVCNRQPDLNESTGTIQTVPVYPSTWLSVKLDVGPNVPVSRVVKVRTSQIRTFRDPKAPSVDNTVIDYSRPPPKSRPNKKEKEARAKVKAVQNSMHRAAAMRHQQHPRPVNSNLKSHGYPHINTVINNPNGQSVLANVPVVYQTTNTMYPMNSAHMMDPNIIHINNTNANSIMNTHKPQMAPADAHLQQTGYTSMPQYPFPGEDDSQGPFVKRKRGRPRKNDSVKSTRQRRIDPLEDRETAAAAMASMSQRHASGSNSRTDLTKANGTNNMPSPNSSVAMLNKQAQQQNKKGSALPIKMSFLEKADLGVEFEAPQHAATFKVLAKKDKATKSSAKRKAQQPPVQIQVSDPVFNSPAKRHRVRGMMDDHDKRQEQPTEWTQEDPQYDRQFNLPYSNVLPPMNDYGQNTQPQLSPMALAGGYIGYPTSYVTDTASPDARYGNYPTNFHTAVPSHNIINHAAPYINTGYPEMLPQQYTGVGNYYNFTQIPGPSSPGQG